MGIGSLATIVIVLVIFFFGMSTFTDAFDEFFKEGEDKEANRVTGNTVTQDTDEVCDLRVTFGVEWDLDRQARFSNLNPFPTAEHWYSGAWTSSGNEKIVTYSWFNCKEVQALSFLDLLPRFTTSNKFLSLLGNSALNLVTSFPSTVQFTLEGKLLDSARSLIDRNDNVKFEEDLSFDLDFVDLPVEEKVSWVVRGVKSDDYRLEITIDDRQINDMITGEPIFVIICREGVDVVFQNKTFKDVWLSAPHLGDFVFFPEDITIPVAVGCGAVGSGV